MWSPNLRITNYLPIRTISQRLLSPGYRFAISKKLAKSTKCTDVLLFDHIHPSDPAVGKGIKTPIGYEKCLIPSLPFASAMNVHVLLQVPPLPAEMSFAQSLYETIPNRKELHVWFEDEKNSGSFIDIYALFKNDKDAYLTLVKKTLENPPVGSNTYHVESTSKLIDSQMLGRTLVLPFQMTDWHKNIFKPLVDKGKIVVPDSADPWVDKGAAHEYFKMYGAGELRPFSTNISMKDIQTVTKTTIHEAAWRVETACRIIQYQGKTPFIKLAANGLSGFGIITPQDNPLLDNSISQKEQSQRFEKIVSNILLGVTSIPDAVVEEYLPVLRDKDGKKEYILSGIVIDEKFYMWSISRSIVDEKGVYQGVLVSPNLTDIGLAHDCLIKAEHEGERFAASMAIKGYNTGYFAKDFVLTNDSNGQEKHIYHDDNDRRGGRTVADFTAALTQKGYCDYNYSVTIPSKIKYSDYIIKMTDALYARGLFIYGTGSAYAVKKKILLRILVPLDLVKAENKNMDTISISKAAKDFVIATLKKVQ